MAKLRRANPICNLPVSPGWIRSREFIEQVGRVCFVERSKSVRQRHFEVALLQPRKARILPNGDFLREGWTYPASEQWGEAGWTYTDLAEARCRYLALGRKGGVEGAGSNNIGDNEHDPPQGNMEAA